MEAEKPKERTFIDRTVDFVFSNDSRKWLILIFILGLLLRIIVSSNLAPVADEMVHGTHAIGVSKLAPLSDIAQGPVWFYLTDYGYRIFGISLLTSRLLSVIFGSLSILLVYGLASMLFNRRAGLIAAFLLAISAFHITWAASYQDQTMMFFILLATFFFVKEYREKKQISLMAAAALGIAELVKIITGVFVITFGIFSLWILFESYKRDKRRFKKNLLRAVLFVAILVVAMLPVISYNYFLYKEKGIVDLAFAQFLRINAEFYTGPGLHHEEGFVLSKLGRNLYTVITHYFMKQDLLVFLIGAAGIAFLLAGFKKGDKKFEIAFLLTMFFFTLVFIASSIVLDTHYTSFFPLFAVFGGAFLSWLVSKEKIKPHAKLVLSAVLIVVLIYSLWSLHGPLTSRSGVEKLRGQVEEISPDALVIVDSRIYRGTIAWAFNDKNYLEASYFSQLVTAGAQGQTRPVETVFVECVPDDCGWGTVGDQPDFNQSMEAVVNIFKEHGTTQEIYGGGGVSGVRGEEDPQRPIFKIYKTSLSLNPAVLGSLDKTHNHFFYYIPRDEYPEEAFDYYTVNGVLDNLLNVISYAILYIAILLAVLSLGLPFYLLTKDKQH